jgi:uncharacterized protein (TIGR02099 family)
VSFAAALRWAGRSSLWTSRAFAWTLIAAALVCASVVLSLRYWILPNIESYREDIAAAVSRAVDLRITIGRISGNWDGMRPHLKLENVTVYDRAGRSALELARVDSTLAWRSIPALRLHFHALDIYRPALAVRRDVQGRLSVAGIQLDADDRRRGSFAEWLLQQPDIEVHDASVSWSDELRAAPVLELSGMRLQMINGGSRHRFGLRALPPSQLAGPIEVRGDLSGDSVDTVSHLDGRVYVQLDSADLAAWGTWVDIPFELTRGSGALRSWLNFSDNELIAVTADVELSGVRARLRKDLPRLELDALTGRLSWKGLPAGFELAAAGLAMEGGGAELPRADFLLRVTDKQSVQQGQLQANALSLGPLVMFADRLPLGEDVRAQLLRYAPQGRVHDLAVTWQGSLPAPARYTARGRFEALSFKPVDKLPGMAGLSGNIDGSERGGTLHVSGQDASFELPQVFAQPLPFDSLTAQIAWTRLPGRTELRFNNVSFANADGAGTASGSYRTAAQGRGDIDVSGNLVRADARGVLRYIPVDKLPKARPWLERAIVAGQSSDVRFKIKGRLEDFPFAQENRGAFQVTAKVTGGILDYAERWPRIEDIEGDLQFRGTRMDFVARQGFVSGVKLGPVQGEIPDLKAIPEVLDIRGEAEGLSADFLAFVARSPVMEMTERFSEGLQAQGNGRLALKLTLPLGQLTSSKVSGTYVFGNNRVVIRDLPPLEQATGRVEFTETSARLPAVSAIFLGGPLTVSGSAQRDTGLRATLQGRVGVDHLRKAVGAAWMQQMRGTADWRGVLTVRKKAPELVIESSLQGISSSLPAPFSKTAGESVPLRFEKRFLSAQQDRISVSYGELVKAELITRNNENAQTHVERGVVRLGDGEAGEPDRPGVWIRGALNTLDFDEWLTLSRSAGDSNGPAAYSIAGVDVKLAQVDFFSRRFNDLNVSGSSQNGVTQLALAGREVEGGVSWRDEGKGRLTARLKKLTLASSEGAPAISAKPPADKPLDLPALDIVVEQLQYGQKQLGKLELNALHQGRDWRIERLRLTGADNVLTADGLWQGWLTQPRTRLNLRMEVSDVGNALERWKLPGGVRRGTARIEGQLGWAGSPYDFDYPTLGGELSVEVANGQFVKLEPGLGKLLGILSLQSLPRRVTLDFRDIFSEGFAFDEIVGAVKVERGIATADNFRIAGPAARVTMSGEVDLVKETQKLRVRVTPHLSESVSIAGALLGGPVAGVAAFLAQKILRDPIEQLASYEYGVTGTWSDPQVQRVERAAAATVNEGTP